MPKFRKKSIVIEAVQLRSPTWSEMCDFLQCTDGTMSTNFISGSRDNCTDPSDKCGESGPFMEVTIPTPKGDMIAKHGDWIIRDVNGEFYPCKPDIFEKTYEEMK